jgi:NTP pyrophosphatase (non-canonical NTP hydrolase)
MKEKVDDLINEIIDKNDEHWMGWRETPLWYWVLCICGETGELAELIKKFYRKMWGWKGQTVGDDFKKNMALEMGDIFIYWVLLCNSNGFDPAEILRETLEKNYERFGWNDK